jgi:hypothetical protein
MRDGSADRISLVEALSKVSFLLVRNAEVVVTMPVIGKDKLELFVSASGWGG